MILEGDVVRLRPIDDGDTDRIVDWHSRDEVRRNFMCQAITRETHVAWMNDVVRTGKAVQFVVEIRTTGQPVGTAFLRDINKWHNRAEFGIFIGEDAHRGRGIGQEATALVLKYGFEELELHRVFLRVLPQNERAICCYEKVGFVREGYLVGDVFVDGKYCDIVLMGIINNKEVPLIENNS